MTTEAFLNGWDSHRFHGKEIDNPYNMDSQSRSYRQWESGWAARFNAVARDLDLSLDEEFPA